MTWTAAFDFYLARMDDALASFFLDLAAAAHAPVTGLGVRLHVVAALKQPREDGLRSAEEAEAVFALEDAVRRVVERWGGRFVGRITWQGASDLVFYVPAAVEDTGPLHDAAGDYELSVRWDDDPDWRFYRDFLYPGPWHLQTIHNRRVQKLLEDNGDQLDRPRLIDHLVLSPRAEPLTELVATLEEHGFRTDPVSEDSAGGFALAFHREDAPEGQRMDEVVAEIFDLLPPGCRYDGWGSEVQRR